jgi:hypothetical protein
MWPKSITWRKSVIYLAKICFVGQKYGYVNCFRVAKPAARHIRHIPRSGPLRGSCAEVRAFFLKIIAFQFPVLKLPPFSGRRP